MNILKTVLKEPMTLFQVACYAMVVLALVLTANAGQDGVRQRQIDEARDKIVAEIHGEADRVIREVGK